MSVDKKLLMIAGPNGSGKTTTALSLLPDLMHIYEFINADEIAKGLAPFHPESMALTASKLMIKRLRELLSGNKGFAFETTAAGTNYIRHLKTARLQNYEIHLIYLWLDNEDLAIQRVSKRVSQGGHHIPEDTIRRRYRSGIKNIMQHYLPFADTALFLDNSSLNAVKVIAQKEQHSVLIIKNERKWKTLQELAHA